MNTLVVTHVSSQPVATGLVLRVDILLSLLLEDSKYSCHVGTHAHSRTHAHKRLSTHICRNLENAAHINTVVMKQQDRLLLLTFIIYNNTVKC